MLFLVYAGWRHQPKRPCLDSKGRLGSGPYLRRAHAEQRPQSAIVVTSQPELRTAVGQRKDLAGERATFHQAAQAGVYEIVNTAVELDLARVRAKVLLEPKRCDMYRFVNSYVFHIHSQSCRHGQELMLIISERILEYGAKTKKEPPTAQGESVNRLHFRIWSVAYGIDAWF